MYSFVFLAAVFVLLLVGGILLGYLSCRSRYFTEPLLTCSGVLLILAFFIGISVYQRLEKMDEQEERRLEQIRAVHR